MSTVWLLCILAFCSLGLFAALMAVIRSASGREQSRQRRLDILEQALRRGDMDAELRHEVVAALKSERTGGFSWRHVWFSLGWLGLFAGGGVAIFGQREVVDAGLMVIVASLAVVTLPLAIRELDARRAPDRESS